MEQMAKRATILGCACVITSKLTVGQLENYRKYLPDALKLKDGISGKVVFSIDLEDGPGSIHSEKAFYSRTKTPGGWATATLVLDPEIEDKAELVRKRIGNALITLDQLEDSLLENLQDLRDTMRRMDEMIGQV